MPQPNWTQRSGYNLGNLQERVTHPLFDGSQRLEQILITNGALSLQPNPNLQTVQI